MTEDLRPPYRIAFDNARDPYAARNALGIAGTGAGLITSVSSPLVVTAGNLTVDLTSSPQGRLTLQTLTPVMISTQSAKTTIYYTPYVGNKVPIYDGTNMVMTTFAELSATTTDTTKSPAAIGASKINDWFVWNDAGTGRIGHGPDWTNDTTRSAGTALVRVNGILLNNASITNGPAAQRGTYVGTTRSNGSSQLDWILGGQAAGGQPANLYVFNAYNRVMTNARCSDATANWTYATTTWRRSNNSASNLIRYVDGLGELFVAAIMQQVITGATAAGGWVGIGRDWSSGFPPGVISNAGTTVTTIPCLALNTFGPAIGHHTIDMVEQAGGGTITFYGDADGSGVTSRMGLTVSLMI